jgi:hypothetical protein
MAGSRVRPLQRSMPFSGAAPDYRMKLAALGDRFAAGTVNQTSACSLARARLGLQLMRGP